MSHPLCRASQGSLMLLVLLTASQAKARFEGRSVFCHRCSSASAKRRTNERGTESKSVSLRELSFHARIQNRAIAKLNPPHEFTMIDDDVAGNRPMVIITDPFMLSLVTPPVRARRRQWLLLSVVPHRAYASFSTVPHHFIQSDLLPWHKSSDPIGTAILLI